jgi:S1-C subfamily serine protease
MSAYGTPGVTGVLVLKVDPASTLAKMGLKPNDVILGLNNSPVISVADLFNGNIAKMPASQSGMKISRNQEQIILPGP